MPSRCSVEFAWIVFVLTWILSQLEGTENSIYVGLLRLFAYGTWSDYKSKLVNIYILYISVAH